MVLNMASRTSVLCLLFVCYLARSCSSALPGVELGLYPTQFGLTGVNLVAGRYPLLTTWFPVLPVRFVSKSIHPGFTIFLVLLSGDVSTNPGPVKFPCGSCAKPVKTNQKGIYCDVCCFWFHANCIGMSNDEYSSLGLVSDTWCCQACYNNALPFANVSALSEEVVSPSSCSPGLTQSKVCAPLSSRSDLTILSSNCRSLVKNLDSIRAFVSTHKPSVFALCETWLDSSISDCEIFIPEYCIVRRDRNRRGGGVLCYIHESTPIISTFSHSSLEFLFVEVSLKGGPSHVGVYYRPPSSSNSLSDLEDCILSIKPNRLKSTVLVGDFNINLLSDNTILRNKNFTVRDGRV